MALSDTLNTNQIKNAAGTEVEMSYLRNPTGNSKEWKLITESPQIPHRLRISHEEVGVGLKLRRRSLLEIKIYEIGADGVTPVASIWRLTGDVPIGNITNYDKSKDALAEVGSLTHTLASNTHLYDGTGNGAVSLLSGGF